MLTSEPMQKYVLDEIAPSVSCGAAQGRAHSSEADGIRYISRHDPQRVCYALFDRSADNLHIKDLGELNGPMLLKEVGRVIDYYKFALVN